MALDVGTVLTKIAVAGSDGVLQSCTLPTAPDQETALASALRAAKSRPGMYISPAGFAVPDAWLDGSVSGAHQHDAMQQVADVRLGWEPTTWVGQLTATAAWAAYQQGLATPDRYATTEEAARQRDFATPGHYLVCDIGYSGVRVALCHVSGRTVRLLTAHAADGTDWPSLDRQIRRLLADGGRPGPATVFQLAEARPHAAEILGQASVRPALRDTPVALSLGSLGDRDLTAGQLIDCFEETDSRLRAGISAVLGDVVPDVAAVSGGWAWFPLVSRSVTAAARVAPDVLAPEAAARGALLVMAGEAHVALAAPPAVELPMHHRQDGVLVEISPPLGPTSSFARSDGTPVDLDRPELTVRVAGELRILRLQGFAPGPHRIGIRPGQSGSGLLVIRSVAREAAAQIHPLDDLEPC
jgi:hypothetical protein